MLLLTAIVMTGLLHASRPALQSASVTCLHEPGTETAIRHRDERPPLGWRARSTRRNRSTA